MTADRFVVLGVAQVRSPWFREVARWAGSAILPMEFVKAMSVEEVRVRLHSGRSYSALLTDDSMMGLDRDLLELAREAGCAVIAVESGRATRSLTSLGASAVLPSSFSRDELLQVLTQVATPIARSTDSSTPPGGPSDAAGFRGRLIAVTGAAGTGRSTVATAIAQGLATDPRNLDLVCLADLSLHGEQAMLHGSVDVVPGLVELVDAHRTGAPSIDEVRRLTWLVKERGYHLLLGLRRHRDWTAVRPRAFEAALDGLRRSYRVVVADVDADLEGEQLTGSVDVEDRNAIARTTVQAAELVVVVGLPGLKGLHGLLRTTRDLLAFGVPAPRLVPLVNRSPKAPRARAELTASFGALLGAAGDEHGVPTPLHLAELRRLDGLLRDRSRLPAAWLAPVTSAVQGLLERSDDAPSTVAATDDELQPIPPGSLGHWSDEEP